MLFSMRHKTYAGQVLDVFLEASSLERATKVAEAYCKKLGHGLVFVKSAIVADESILAPEVPAPAVDATGEKVSVDFGVAAQAMAAGKVAEGGPVDRMAAARAAKAAKKGGEAA